MSMNIIKKVSGSTLIPPKNLNKNCLPFKYEIRKIPGKGQGIVTLEPLKKGFQYVHFYESNVTYFNSRSEVLDFFKKHQLSKEEI